MIGRTEQRLKQYKFIVPISDRIFTYIEAAKSYTKNDDSIYTDMHKLYIRAGGEQKGIDAIFMNFELEICEIVFVSGHFKYDCDFIEALEEWWIDAADARNPIKGYNIGTGHWGPHIGHNKIEIDSLILKNMIANGYSQCAISSYFGVSRKKIFNSIKEFWPDTKGNFYNAQKKFLKPQLENYIMQGYTQKEIAKSFPSTERPNGINRFTIDGWCKKYWNGKIFSEVQELLLKGILRSLIIEGLTIKQMSEDNRLSMSEFRITMKIRLYWPIPENVITARQTLENARKELRTPILLECLKQQYSNKKIVEILNFPSLKHLSYYTQKIIHKTPSEGRLFFKTKLIEPAKNFFYILPYNYY